MLLAPSIFSPLNHFSIHVTKNQKQKQNNQNKTKNGHSSQVFACWFTEILFYQFVLKSHSEISDISFTQDFGVYKVCSHILFLDL